MLANHHTMQSPLEIALNTGKINFTDREKLIFVGLVETQKDVIESKVNDNKMIEKKDMAWKEIAELYNARPSAHRRTPKQLKALWKNLKAKAKSDAKKTRGMEDPFGVDGTQPEYASILSPLMQKVISVMLSVHDDNVSMLDDVFGASGDGVTSLTGDIMDDSPSNDSTVKPLPGEIVVIKPSESDEDLATRTSTDDHTMENEANTTKVKTEPPENVKTVETPIPRVATPSGPSFTIATATESSTGTVPITPATQGENINNSCKRKPNFCHINGPSRKRMHSELMEDFERKRLLEMEREAHEQRMKNMKLEAEVLELKRVKLQKQIALLSNFNVFNMAMQ